MATRRLLAQVSRGVLVLIVHNSVRAKLDSTARHISDLGRVSKPAAEGRQGHERATAGVERGTGVRACWKPQTRPLTCRLCVPLIWPLALVCVCLSALRPENQAGRAPRPLRPVHPLACLPSPPPPRSPSTAAPQPRTPIPAMPRKAAAAATGAPAAADGDAPEPRRSSRIKDQPKTDEPAAPAAAAPAPKKTPAKPRAKKAAAGAADGAVSGGEDKPAAKPKSAARGTKRKAADTDDAPADGAAPPAKKVRLPRPLARAAAAAGQR